MKTMLLYHINQLNNRQKLQIEAFSQKKENFCKKTSKLNKNIQLKKTTRSKCKKNNKMLEKLKKNRKEEHKHYIKTINQLKQKRQTQENPAKVKNTTIKIQSEKTTILNENKKNTTKKKKNQKQNKKKNMKKKLLEKKTHLQN